MNATIEIPVWLPTLLVVAGLLAGAAIMLFFDRASLADVVSGHRQLAVNDAQSARWLWLRGYRKSPHAGPDIHEGVVVTPSGARIVQTTHPELLPADPDVSGEVLAVDGVDTEVDARHDDTDRPRWWATVIAFMVLAPVALVRRQWPVLVEWAAYRFKSQAARDAEFAETYHRALEQARDERKPRGMSNVVAGNWITAEQTPEPEPVRIVRRDRYRPEGMTGQFPYVKVAGAPRHAAPEPEFPAINVPLQREGCDDL